MPSGRRPKTPRPKSPSPKSPSLKSRVVARPLPASAPSDRVSDAEARKRAFQFADDDIRHQEMPDFMRETARLPIIARRFGVSLTKVYDWIDVGLPSFRIGREHLVHVPTADAWI